MKRVKTLAAISMAMVLGLMNVSCVSEWKKLHVSFDDDEPKIEEVRQLKDFMEIEVNGSPSVVYAQADSFSVVVTGTDKAVSNIETTVSNGVLNVRNRGKLGKINIEFGDNSAVVRVTSPDLLAVRVNGSGDFYSENHIDTDNLKISLRGSGDIKMNNIICDYCDIDVVGSGDVELERLEAIGVSSKLVGSGDIELGLHRVENTNINLTGSGDVKAYFRDNCGSVNAQVSGSGDINLLGEVKLMISHKAGSGDINTDGLKVVK